MFAKRFTVDVVTDASGDAVAYSDEITGEVVSIRYVKDGTAPFEDTVDFTIIGEDTGQGFWTEANVTATKTCMPRQDVHTLVGVARVYTAGEEVGERLAMAGERLKFTIAQGGDTKSGRFYITVV